VSGNWIADACEFRFPKDIWQAFPKKQAFINELAYISTLSVPLILKDSDVWYDTPIPRFIEFYNRCFALAIPNLVEYIPEENANDILGRLTSLNRHFFKKTNPEALPQKNIWHKKRAVLPFTYGKDSLLSLVTLKSLGYEVIPVFIDERMLPRGLALRNELYKEFREQHNLEVHRVENEIQLLSDYQVLEIPETRLYQVHVHFIYLMAMIPFCYYFDAPHIIFSNEFHNSLDQVFKENHRCAHLVMQSREIDKELSNIAEQFSGGQIKAVNPIDVLGDFSIHRILHEKFPEFARYRISCHLETAEHDKWCHDCYRCAQAFVFFLAQGKDPFEEGFETSMLELDKKNHFSLFQKEIHPDDEYHRFISEEEELAFLMARTNGAKGPLVDLFTEKFINKPDARRKKLEKRVFRLQTTPGSSAIQKEAAAFYKETLSGYLPRKKLFGVF
jgi:hypothetical protein